MNVILIATASHSLAASVSSNPVCEPTSQGYAISMESWPFFMLFIGAALPRGREAGLRGRSWTDRLGMLFSLVLASLVCGCVTSHRGKPAREGIPNFGEVNPRLFRGGQPDRAGIETLKRRGVGTVINLRQADDVWAEEEALVRAAGMRYFNIPMSGSRRPTDSQVRTVLSLIEGSASPVFVHCRLGCDRTGTVVACYRLQHDQWSRNAAMQEARRYGISAWVFGMRRFIKEFSESSASTGKQN